MSEKRQEIAILNQEEKRLDDLGANNNNGNRGEEDAEIFYVTGSWQFPETFD